MTGRSPIRPGFNLGAEWFDFAVEARPRIARALRLNLTEDASARAREEATQLGHPDDEWMADLPQREAGA